MKQLFIILPLLIVAIYCNAQAPTGKATTILDAPLLMSTDNISVSNNWNFAIKVESAKGHGVPNANSFYEHKNANAIKQPLNDAPVVTKKTRALPPAIGTNFRGNKLEFLTPSDNSIAISNGGKIVSVNNCTIEYYNEDGTPLQQNTTWNDFLNNDTSLLLGKYDPRVLYDNIHDRFITIILHGPLSKTKNKIILAFSKTNNPVDGWHIYTVNGNPYADSSFCDYPNMGITNNELFINLNLFKNFSPYNYNQTVIYQFAMVNGYAGSANLSYKVWGDSITTSTGLPGFTLVPAPNGLGQSNGPDMWFVSTWPDGDSNVYAYRITKELTDTTGQLLQYKYSIPPFSVCPNGAIKNLVTGAIDTINTGSSVVQSAFILDSNIHFTLDANFNNGWCGINYGRINLRNNSAKVTTFGVTGTMLCYPAIASFGNTATDKNVVIAYVQADTNTYPQSCAIAADEIMNFSTPIVVKKGDTIVNILAANNMPERWGDYSGIHRKYNSTTGSPEVWMAGDYGATNAGPARYNMWIAQLLNSVKPNAINTIDNNITKSEVYPNPINNVFTTQFNNQIAGEVLIHLVGSNGGVVQTFYQGYMQAGKVKMQFNKAALAAGVYQLQIINNNKVLHNHAIQIL